MDKDCHRVFERLYEHRYSDKFLELADFADLGLPNNQIQERLKDLCKLGWVRVNVHHTSQDAGGVDRVAATITIEGCEAFEHNYD